MLESYRTHQLTQEIGKKLFYSPGACSLSPHIVAQEAGIDLQLVRVDTKTKTIAAEGDYWAINPKGYVPAIEAQWRSTRPGDLQYLADLKPESNLAPANGTWARTRLQETLNYITSEIHKSYSPLFNPKTPDEVRIERKEYLRKRYALLERQLEGRKYLSGDQFTIADAYLFAVTNWARGVKLDLSDFPNLLAFQQRVAARPAVRAAMLAEGLIPTDKAA